MAEDETDPQLQAALNELSPEARQIVLSRLERSAAAVNSGSGSATATVLNAETIYVVLGDALKREAESEALADYLNVLRQESSRLPLAGVDKDAADPNSIGAPQLDQVYVELQVNYSRRVIDGAKQLADKTSNIVDFRESEDPATALFALGNLHRAVILGDPGSGKSTFLRILAIHFADALGRESDDANLPDDWPFEEALVPIFVTLRDFAAALDPDDKLKPVTRLTRFLKQQLQGDDDTAAAAPILERFWKDGKAILLLDGLDEIARTDRRDAVLAAITEFAARHESTRILITCRVASYEPPDPKNSAAADWRLDDKQFPALTLAPFTGTQQHRFIERWYAELKRRDRIHGDPVQRSERLKRALARADVARLAPNPLLLAVMCLVDADGGNLPDDRVKLYKEAVDVLLRRWRQGRDPDDDAPDSVVAILDQVGRTTDDLEQRLWTVAYEVHAETDDHQDAIADISLGRLIEALRGLHPGPSGERAWATELVEALKHRAGLLIERSPGVFTFPHRTFQEYLAARELASRKMPDPDFKCLPIAPLWREVLLLASGSFVHLGHANPAPVFPILQQLLDNHEPSDLTFAADLLCEMKSDAFNRSGTGPELAEAIRQQLQDGCFGKAPHPEIKPRAAMAAAFGRLGDDRDGVHEIRWSKKITAPKSGFLMGSEDGVGRDNEHPRFRCSLIEEDYAISIFPVTVDQFRQFQEGGGYSEAGRDFWTDAGRAWKDKNRITGPETYAEVYQTPNHPQVGVSWFEAAAFCNWFTARSGQSVRLPTEPEWERAARQGGKRTYPWGESENEKDVYDHCNIGYTDRIGSTSAVGLFSNGQAPCGAFDLSGNVWEWTVSIWRNDYGGYNEEHDAALERD
ncbi:MAG: SUMF1/EgtB/PvdO family nonheme iron enzyme, partial [Verrucomicrobiota bacterium]